MLADAAEKKIKKENIKMPKFDITKLNVAIDKLLEVIKPSRRSTRSCWVKYQRWKRQISEQI
jgi:hypothetical protein